MKSPDQTNLSKFITIKLNEKHGLTTVPLLKHLSNQNEMLETQTTAGAVLLEDQSTSKP